MAVGMETEESNGIEAGRGASEVAGRGVYSLHRQASRPYPDFMQKKLIMRFVII